ncbi:hypothetical protein GCM10020254_85810 [Streptomyces goshikiensis]
MCRIYGYFNAVASPHEMRTVAALQHHGGPDATGIHQADGWGLGNNRLAVVDLDGGRQPYGEGGLLRVVFNGEIYNHGALRHRLEALGHTFDDHCDGNVIPALYLEYGDDFTEHLDGMYSIALVDLRGERPRLLLATDGIGMKPLYYRWDAAARSLHFSSEIPALFGFGGAVARVRETALDAYLATRTPFGGQTMFEDVEVMAPATTLVCVLGGVPRSRRRPVADVQRPGPGDGAATAVRVRRALREEVGRLLVADVPVALITSGGLDSSLVTALAAEHGPVHSFNIAYKGDWPFDERHFARQAAERARAAYHQVEIDPADFPALLERTVWHLGQPNADPIALSTYALFQAVRAAGFTVALTGDAADEVFGGYERMRHAAETAAAGGDWAAGYLDALSAVPAAVRRSLYTDDFRDALRGIPALPADAEHDLRRGPGTVLERVTRFELGYRLPAYHLRRVDHLSMAGSIECGCRSARAPWWTSAGRCPTGCGCTTGRSSGPCTRRPRACCPTACSPVPSSRSPLPITAMLRPGAPMWSYARDLLTPARLDADGRLDAAAVQALFAAQAERPGDATALALWSLLTHEVWREQFRPGLAGATPSAAAPAPVAVAV